MNETALIEVEELNALALFTEPKAMDPLLGKIEEVVRSHVPDVNTAGGRKDIASLSRKVASSKVILDNLGKDLVADWKRKAKTVDVVRKDMRDRLDALRDEAREPLTRWEAEEACKQEEARLAAEYDRAWDDARTEYDLRERERIVRQKEAELARQEEERRQQEEAERLAREQAEREERIAREAAEKAKREAEEAVQRERERAEQAEREQIAAEARAKAEREAAVREAERKAKEEAERKDRERLAAEKAEREKQERLAANKRHRARIDTEITQDIQGVCEAEGMAWDTECVKSIIMHINKGHIRHVSINY